MIKKMANYLSIIMDGETGGMNGLRSIHLESRYLELIRSLVSARNIFLQHPQAILMANK